MKAEGLALLLMMSCGVVQNVRAQGMITGDILASELSKTVDAVGWSFMEVPEFLF